MPNLRYTNYKYPHPFHKECPYSYLRVVTRVDMRPLERSHCHFPGEERYTE